MRFICIFCVVASMACSGLVKAQKLSKEEKLVVQQIDANMHQANDLLLKVVAMNSGTMNFKGVKKVALVFMEEFQKLGLKTQWIDGKKFNRAGHLYAEIGNKGPKILLIGHLDTVFPLSSPFQKYRRLDGNRLSGPGTTDMKGGDVIIWNLMKTFKTSGLLNRFQFRILLMGDEERRGLPMNLSTQKLVESGQWADVALGFEDGDGDPETAVVSRRGAISWRIDIKGKPAHSSQIFQPAIGDGAIYEGARILNTFRTELQKESLLTFNPGLFMGGTTVNYDDSAAGGKGMGKNNVIAKTAVITGDIRAIDPAQVQRVKANMKAIVSRNLPGTDATITFEPGYPPMARTKGNLKLLKFYSDASEDLGFGLVKAVNPRNAGAADISFVAADVCMALDGLGLMGSGGHTIKETALMDTFQSQTQRAAITILRLERLLSDCSQ